MLLMFLHVYVAHAFMLQIVAKMSARLGAGKNRGGEEGERRGRGGGSVMC
jgi:hypothetical protein